jgi:hypothetical protein
MKTILLYSNCHGEQLIKLFENHNYTKDKFIMNYLNNYGNLQKENIDENHINLLKNCDIFIYQPFNKIYENSDYDIPKIKMYLKPETIIIKVNFYRFNGFWYDSNYSPYTGNNGFTFPSNHNSGVHNSFINFTGNKDEIKNKIDNLYIEKNDILDNFNSELEKFKKLDDNSDVKMYNYFINNYKQQYLFHDKYHPTNIFFYEIFIQLVFKLTEYQLPSNDIEFINSLKDYEMTRWTTPILPIIKDYLELQIPDKIFIFFPDRFYMDIYDYYYIRLSQNNLKSYLDSLNYKYSSDEEKKITYSNTDMNFKLKLYANKYKKYS